MSKFQEYKDTKPSVLIKAFLDLVTDGPFEIRIPKTKYGTIAGYFTDTAIAAMLAAKENGKHPAIYVTMNPIDPAIAARNENKLEYGTHTTTTDAEIVKRRWFLLDLDPVRPAGISSTQLELEAAVERADTIVDWLRSIGWPEPVRAISGNGAHVMYRVDEPNDEETRIEFEYATKMLATIFDDDIIHVDTTVWNASRIWKIGGTIAAKGSSTAERPHRVAMLSGVPKDIQLVNRGQIEALARPFREAKADEFKDMTGEYIGDMQRWLADRGMTVTSGPRPLYGSEGRKWILSRCPFNNNHIGPVVGLLNNRPIYRCLHNSCAAFRWKEFREKIDPNFKDPETVYLRLKEWCESDATTCDDELLETAARTGKKLEGILKRLKKDCPRPRVSELEVALKEKRRAFLRETIGENNEKGNIVGLINRTRQMQAEGIVPLYWVADYDHAIRVGTLGDTRAERINAEHEVQLLVKFHSLGDSWVKQTHCSQIISFLAQEYRVNPLKMHFKEFIWDGTPRLDTWLIHYMGCKDTEYTRSIGRKWLISAVARAFDPGCQADHMLIFEGKQGIGKSRALRILGGVFYTEHSKPTGGFSGLKDFVHVIIGKVIVEMSELATLKRADMESLKAILTTPVDDARLSYERHARSYPRTCVFAGTTNEIGQAYIADATGARRFWPCLTGEVGPVRTDLLAQDREQLWAEAVDAYEAGENWWETPVESTLNEQLDRQITPELSDPWYLKIRGSLTDPASYENDLYIPTLEYYSGNPTGRYVLRVGRINEVLGILLGVDIERQSANDLLRLKSIYRAIGFKKVRPSKGWFDGAYAYEIQRESLGHLWPAIHAALMQGKPSFRTELEALLSK